MCFCEQCNELSDLMTGQFVTSEINPRNYFKYLRKQRHTVSMYCVCVLQVENINTSCIQLITHWLLKQTYQKVHYRTVTTLCLRCKHQLHNSETLGILFWKPARCKYSTNDPHGLYECREVPYYSINAAPNATRRTHKSLIGFRQNTLLRITNKETFHDVLNLPALSLMTRTNTSKNEACTTSSVRSTSDLQWGCRGSSLVPSQRRTIFGKAPHSAHTSQYIDLQGGRFYVTRLVKNCLS